MGRDIFPRKQVSNKPIDIYHVFILFVKILFITLFNINIYRASMTPI